MTIYIATPNSYVSNAIDLRPALLKEDLKALTREFRREETLLAQNWLAWFHDQEKLEERHLEPMRYHRPGRRRTCTAVRNFRRAW